MALLSSIRRLDAAGASRLLLAAAAVALAGCVLLEKVGLRGGDDGLRFSHRLHVEDQGFDCADCHLGVEDSDEPGMPVEMQCMLCHEDLDEEKPPERRVASFFEDGRFVAQRRSELADEVVFSHLRHVETAYDCSACHGDIAETDRILSEVAVPMDQCTACHAEAGVSNACATCHTQIDRDWAPPSHEHHWDLVHGQAFRAKGADVVDRCSLCHTESTCTTCHETQPPRDHTNFWRRRGHAFEAALDRSRCSACHQPDLCNQCHSETRPITHVGPWGGTLSTHCLSCHFPLKSTGCFTCHKDADSHLLAPPKPPDHFPGMDCRQCHGLTAPLPHVDNGADCNICHL